MAINHQAKSQTLHQRPPAGGPTGVNTLQDTRDVPRGLRLGAFINKAEAGGPPLTETVQSWRQHSPDSPLSPGVGPRELPPRS